MRAWPSVPMNGGLYFFLMICEMCEGSRKVPCLTCRGRGQIYFNKVTEDSVCPDCKGMGVTSCPGCVRWSRR